MLGLAVSKICFNCSALLLDMLMLIYGTELASGHRESGKYFLLRVVNISLITDLWWLARSQANICKSCSSIPALCLDLSLSLLRSKACETSEFCVLLPDASCGSDLLLVANRFL